MGNPKLEGSGIIEAIPQTGECPIGCDECFYNGKRFYRSLDTPLLPSLQEAQGNIVRVNSGHDSNVQRGLVIKSTEQYLDKFYNTSIANFDFPGPVVFTANGRKPILAKRGLDNLMFVRARTRTRRFRIRNPGVHCCCFLPWLPRSRATSVCVLRPTA